MAKRISTCTRLPSVVVATAILAATLAAGCALAAPLATASSAFPHSDPIGAINGERFSAEPGYSWKGDTAATNWWWQIRFDTPRDVGAILQIVGDHPFVLRNAPRKFVWRGSRDGQTWFDLKETTTANEQRTFRLLRLKTARKLQYLRLQIDAVTGEFPTLREVEFYDSPKARVKFDDLIVVVNTTEKPDLPGHGQEFIPLARACPGWENIQAQQVWLDSFEEAFVAAEPRPLCAFLSGNFKDWCEIAREPWRGTQDVMKHGRLPMWASCGGAQGLAILAETGVDKPWDCPHCRDSLHPKSPIYTHIGHTATRPCGDYSACVFERGPFTVRQVALDPVFQGLPRDFAAMQSHCGQIEWPPKGWSLIAGAGPGTQTKTQCLRMNDRYIYAAQFHIEMDGAPETSRQIMGNFLALAKAWGGYNPKGQPRTRPKALTKQVRQKVPDKLVVLTFDDAVASHYTVVRPLLKEYKFSATFFITEGFGFLTNKNDYLTWNQIAGLHKDGFEIGNHTRDHLGVTAQSLGRLKEQVEAINARCREHDIPRPTSFAYPGNSITPEALKNLKDLGFTFARRGGAPEFPYEQGRGFAFEPGQDHPLLIPSAGDARPNWTLEDFKRAVTQARDGHIAVLQFHGVPDREHPWVHTPPDLFKQYMKYLRDEGFKVIALRDLARYVDPEKFPENPFAIIEERKELLQSAEKK